MDKTIRQICDGAEYHARFSRTKISKILQSSEESIDDYFYGKGDEDYSEVIFMPSIGRGIYTWFVFNKLERIISSGFLDYHKNLPIDKLKYTYNPDIDLEIAQITLWGEDNSWGLVYAFMRKKKDFCVQLMITDFNEFHLKVEFSEPVFIQVSVKRNSLVEKLKKILNI